MNHWLKGWLYKIHLEGRKGKTACGRSGLKSHTEGMARFSCYVGRSYLCKQCAAIYRKRVKRAWPWLNR